MTSESYTYETKCRRCGTLKEWFFSNKSMVKWTGFAHVMNDHLTHPRLLSCDNCGKSTIQDVVSYTDAHS